MGKCISKYWTQKKIMAPGSEPLLCSKIMKILEPYVLGQSLAGAGGGGFLFAVTKQPMQKIEVEELLKELMVIF